MQGRPNLTGSCNSLIEVNNKPIALPPGAIGFMHGSPVIPCPVHSDETLSVENLR